MGRSTPEYQREWRRLNPEKVRASEQKRRGRKRDPDAAKVHSKRYYDTVSGNIKRRLLVINHAARKKGYAECSATVEEVIVVLKGPCKICEQILPLRIDHDHQTGNLRGGLCHKCNSALGLFGDDPAIMEKAIRYVSRSH